MKDKVEEALAAVLPIVGLVLLLSFSIAPVSPSILLCFLIGAYVERAEARPSLPNENRHPGHRHRLSHPAQQYRRTKNAVLPYQRSGFSAGGGIHIERHPT